MSRTKGATKRTPRELIAASNSLKKVAKLEQRLIKLEKKVAKFSKK